MIVDSERGVCCVVKDWVLKILRKSKRMVDG